MKIMKIVNVFEVQFTIEPLCYGIFYLAVL